MKIEEVSCFALKGDGTLLIKINMDKPDDSYRYCFYIYKGSETLFKSPYDRKSFLMYKVDEFGKYQIKAFVRNANGSEKDSMVIPYVVNKDNARELAGDVIEVIPNATIELKKYENNMIIANVTGEFSDEVQYAWYVYYNTDKEPVFKSKYSIEASLSYIAKKKGNYLMKLFVKDNGKKFVYKSESINI